MLSTPRENLKYFVKSRPPLTIFLICLITITLASFGFAYYIHNTDRVFNRDEQQNWLYFLKYLNAKEYCIENFASAADPNADIIRGTDKVYIPAIVSFPNGVGNFSDVRGPISVNEWPCNCNAHLSEQVVTAAFNLQNSLTEKKANVCVILDLPPDLLSPFFESRCSSDFTITPTLNTLATKNESNSDQFCTNGTKIGIKFDERKSRSFEIYLTTIEQNTIYVHLMWLSSIFLFVIIIMLCYAMFVTKTNEDKL